MTVIIVIIVIQKHASLSLSRRVFVLWMAVMLSTIVVRPAINHCAVFPILVACRAQDGLRIFRVSVFLIWKIIGFDGKGRCVVGCCPVDCVCWWVLMVLREAWFYLHCVYLGDGGGGGDSFFLRQIFIYSHLPFTWRGFWKHKSNGPHDIITRF